MAQDITKTKLKLAPHQIILRPLVTEKGMHKANRYNAYAFEVNRLAGKDDIRRAVEELFDVRVTGVHIVNRKGKPILRYGRTVNHRPASRKAYVTLAEGSKTLEFFEGI